MHTMLRQKITMCIWRFVHICLVTTNGKLVVWDSNYQPKEILRLRE